MANIKICVTEAPGIFFILIEKGLFWYYVFILIKKDLFWYYVLILDQDILFNC